VSVTLGSGVAVIPDSTTVALGPGNDAVRDTLGQLGTGGQPITIGTSDGMVPTIANVTIAAIDDALNGTGPRVAHSRCRRTAGRSTSPTPTTAPSPRSRRRSART
jgi:hypothetical protein